MQNNEDTNVVLSAHKVQTFADVIITQMICVVLVAILFVAVNTFFPVLSNELYKEYEYNVNLEAKELYNDAVTSIRHILNENTEHD